MLPWALTAEPNSFLRVWVGLPSWTPCSRNQAIKALKCGWQRYRFVGASLASVGNFHRISRMTRSELEQYQPDLLAEIEAEAARDERERQRMLDSMSLPGCQAIIAKATVEGSSPSSIAQECLQAVREKE
jgi:hypothetical protein